MERQNSLEEATGSKLKRYKTIYCLYSLSLSLASIISFFLFENGLEELKGITLGIGVTALFGLFSAFKKLSQVSWELKYRELSKE